MLWYLTGSRKSRRAQCPTMAENETDQQENENPAEAVPCRATSTSASHRGRPGALGGPLRCPGERLRNFPKSERVIEKPEGPLEWPRVPKGSSKFFFFSRSPQRVYGEFPKGPHSFKRMSRLQDRISCYMRVSKEI